MKGGHSLELTEFHFLIDEEVVHIVDVDASQTYWHGGCVLERNALYRVRMSFDARWTINRNVTTGARDGRGNVGYSADDSGIGGGYGPIDSDQWPAGVPDPSDTYNPTSTTWRWAIYPGWVYVLVWQDHRHAVVKRLRPPEYEFRAGAEGASIHFLVADLNGAYGDNAGTCRIRVVKVT